ncbi:hypothetical protein IGI37_001918 [Enterococcus sp. AZ194]|uniref:DNA topology modulation protein n=1 Tax=Enterococcus sp. AZ194 TaxID=2774629 RepID=UPI003F282F63
MKKIIIIGSSGAGKSTLSRALSKKLSIPTFHLDQLLWKPHWQMSEKEEQIAIQKELLTTPTWIIDGNYSGTLPMRIQAADTIIFLDRNRLICIYQVLKRVKMYHGTIRPDMQEDCPEKFDLAFLKWIWNFPKKGRLRIKKELGKLPNSKRLVILKSKKQIDQFLASL